MTLVDFGVGVFAYVRSVRTHASTSVAGTGRGSVAARSGGLGRGSCGQWARARVDGVGEGRVAFKPLVPLRGRPAGDVVGANEGEGGATRRWALVGKPLECVLAGSVQRTGGLKATLHSSWRWRGGRAAWGGVRWWRVRVSVRWELPRVRFDRQRPADGRLKSHLTFVVPLAGWPRGLGRGSVAASSGERGSRFMRAMGTGQGRRSWRE